MSITDLYRVLSSSIYVVIYDDDEQMYADYIDNIPLRYMEKAIQSMNVCIDDTYGLMAVIGL